MSCTQQKLPPDVRAQLDNCVIPDAKAIFAAVRSRLILALASQHGDEVNTVISEISALYTRHRAGVDKLIKLVTAAVDQVDASAAATK